MFSGVAFFLLHAILLSPCMFFRVSVICVWERDLRQRQWKRQTELYTMVSRIHSALHQIFIHYSTTMSIRWSNRLFWLSNRVAFEYLAHALPSWFMLCESYSLYVRISKLWRTWIVWICFRRRVAEWFEKTTRSYTDRSGDWSKQCWSFATHLMDDLELPY